MCACMYVCMATFSNIFSSETTSRLKPNFIWSLLETGERKFVQMVLVTWPRWPPYPYIVKTLKSLLLRNQKANDFETWYAASGTWVIPNLFKWWSWVDLDLFYARSNLVPYAFVWQKGKTMDFSETIVVYDVKVCRCSKLNDNMNLYEYPRSRSFNDLGPRSLRLNIFKFLFLRNCVADWSQILCGASMGWGNESLINGLSHMTNMANMPIYCKNLKKKSSSLEPKGRWPWSWYAALGSQVLPRLFKWWSWNDSDLFYGKVKFGPMCFCMGKKGKTMDFLFRNHCSLWYKSWKMHSTKWVHEASWVPKVKVIHWPWAKWLRFNIFKLLFLNDHLADWSHILSGVSLEWGNESLFKLFRSHDQDGHHVHIC